MKKVLTDYEKELIGVILDYEKAYIEQQERVQIALLGETANTPDIVDFSRVKAALKLEDTGDAAVDVIYGYVRNEFTLDEVLWFIELVINDDYDGIKAWWVLYE